MPKQSKAQKRKIKLEQRRKTEIQVSQQQTETLMQALSELCEPSFSEYVDDGEKLDLAGRTILFRLGAIGWNAAIRGVRDFDEYLKAYATLDKESLDMIHQEVHALRQRKLQLFPKIKTGIRDVSFILKNGIPQLKLKPLIINPAEFASPEIILASEIITKLEQLGTQEAADVLKRYHKVEHRYFGVRSSAILELTNAFAVKHSEEEILAVCKILWDQKCHEAFLAAGKLLAHQKVTDKNAIWDCLCIWRDTLDSRSMSDTLQSAARKVLKAEPQFLDVLEKEWLTHSNPWVRRACLVFTSYSPTTDDDIKRSLRWIAKLVTDSAPAVQKAVGSHLKKLFKYNPQVVKKFMQNHAGQLSPHLVRQISACR